MIANGRKGVWFCSRRPQWIRSARGDFGPPARLSAGHRHQVEVRASLAIGDKRNPFAIRRQERRTLALFSVSQLVWIAAIDPHYPDMAGMLAARKIRGRHHIDNRFPVR